MSIKSLPTEILCDILLETTIIDDPPTWKYGPAGRPSADVSYLLSSVCFLWRNIVINTPKMWSYLVVRPEFRVSKQRPNSLFQKRLAKLELQLERSRTHLLDVAWSTDTNEAHTAELFGMIQAKGPFCRWRTLLIHYDYWKGYVHAIRHEDRFHNLLALNVRSCQKDGFLPIINQSLSSKLTHFENDDSSMPSSLFLRGHMKRILLAATRVYLPELSATEQADIPTNIVEASISSPGDANISHLERLRIRRPTNMHRLSNFKWSTIRQLDICFYNSAMNVTQQPVFFPLLHTLTLRGSYYTPICSISAPQLDHLVFKPEHESVKQLVQSVDVLLSETTLLTPPLKTLDIGFSPTETLLTKVILYFSELVVLKIEISDSYDGWELIRNTICNQKHVASIRASAARDNVQLADGFMERLATLELRPSRMWHLQLRNKWSAYMSRILRDTRGKRLETIRCIWPKGLLLERTRDMEEEE